MLIVMREEFCDDIEKITYLFVKQGEKKKKKLEGWRRVEIDRGEK